MRWWQLALVVAQDAMHRGDVALVTATDDKAAGVAGANYGTVSIAKFGEIGVTLGDDGSHAIVRVA